MQLVYWNHTLFWISLTFLSGITRFADINFLWQIFLFMNVGRQSKKGLWRYIFQIPCLSIAHLYKKKKPSQSFLQLNFCFRVALNTKVMYYLLHLNRASTGATERDGPSRNASRTHAICLWSLCASHNRGLMALQPRGSAHFFVCWQVKQLCQNIPSFSSPWNSVARGSTHFYNEPQAGLGCI